VSSAQLTGTALLDRLREIQRQKQALEVEELGLIAQVEAENLAYDLGARTSAVLLRDLLHISARDAAGRVKLAAAVMPRRLLTGELVEPRHSQTAQALVGVTRARPASPGTMRCSKPSDCCTPPVSCRPRTGAPPRWC
jgi:hypothetical protein